MGMGKLGHGYGSEFHLMRIMARHRCRFTNSLEAELGLTNLCWLDFTARGKYQLKPAEKFSLPDREPLAIDFLSQPVMATAFGANAKSALKEWPKYWPVGGGTMNWDAIGLAQRTGIPEVLLVEAKGHIGELSGGPSTAKDPKSIKLITAALDKTANKLSATKQVWIKSDYYQFANRLAVLRYLQDHDINATVLHILFCGDLNDGLRKDDVCPKDAAGWKAALDEMHAALGVTEPTLHTAGVCAVAVDVVSLAVEQI
jgi:hypothetical protein